MNMDGLRALWVPQYWADMLPLQLASCTDVLALATTFFACIGFLITFFFIEQSNATNTKRIAKEEKRAYLAEPAEKKPYEYLFSLQDMLSTYYMSCSKLSACLEEKQNGFETSHVLSLEEREQLDAELNCICSMTNQIIVYLNLTAPEEEGVRQLLVNINIWGYEIIKSLAENNRKETILWKTSFDEHVRDVQAKLNARLVEMQ